MTRREAFLLCACLLLLGLVALLLLHAACPTCQRRWTQTRRRAGDFLGRVGSYLME